MDNLPTNERSDNALLTDIHWYRLRSRFHTKKNSSIMKGHPVSVIQAIVKAVSSRIPTFSSLEKEDLPIFHILDQKHTFKMTKGQTIIVDFLFCRKNINSVKQWAGELSSYLNETPNNRTLELIELSEVEERNYNTLNKEWNNLPNSGELCLEFLMPLPFKREPGKSRVFVSKDHFISTFEKRFSTLFSKQIKYKSNNDNFQILPYYWKYTEIKHSSKSLPGTTQLINGVIGKLYLKGNWKDFLPFLILGNELHTGSKYSNSQGYYRIIKSSPPYFANFFPDQKDLIAVLRDVIERYDQALESFSQNEMYPFDEKAFSQQLEKELKEGTYHPTVNRAFLLQQKNKKDRIVEQLNFKDLVVCQYLNKSLYRIFDNCFEEESIGFRKGISRNKAIKMVQTAINDGYRFVIESDIEDFFPSIDLSHLEKLLDSYMPSSDTLIKDLLKKIIRNGYQLNGQYRERLKGLPLGNPLSPCLSNLYLDDFDEQIKTMDVRLIRYADDFIILCKDQKDTEDILCQTKNFLSEIGLKIKAEKTAIRSIESGFSFLGMKFEGSNVTNMKNKAERPFKKPLYITEPYVFLSLNGDVATIKKDQKILESIPLRRISEIMVLDKTVFSTGFIRYCVQNHIPFTITLNNGYYITTIKPDNKKYFDLSYNHGRKFFSLSETERLCIAKEFATGKIKNYILMLKKKYRKVENDLLNDLFENISRIHQAGDINQVRGIEGISARKVFACFNDHIKYSAFHIEKRSRRRPDRINSLLNFGYYMLFSRINATVRAMGLNPYLGFLHSSSNTYESFVCDIQELFRANIDNFIFRLINTRIINEDDFVENRGGYYLRKEGVAKFLNQMEIEMNKKLGKSTMSLKEHIYTQILVIKNWLIDNKTLSFYLWGK